MKIVLVGYGKMGHEVEKIALQRGHEIIAKIDQDDDWQKEALNLEKADVAIEFSIPGKVVEHINRCFDLHLPIVVGTTAWYDQLPNIDKRCNNEQQSLFYAPNFSIGMNMMFQLNRELAKFAEKYNYNLSLSEIHHIHKLDKPSGTAIKLANDIIEENYHYTKWSIDEIDSPNTLPIEVIREGEVSGTHQVMAESKADKLTIIHEAFNRQGFAVGAVIAAEFLIGKKGCFTMKNLMDDFQ